MDKKLLNRLVLARRDNIIAWRRRIHQHPELGLDCFRTADLVADTLRQLPRHWFYYCSFWLGWRHSLPIAPPRPPSSPPSTTTPTYRENPTKPSA